MARTKNSGRAKRKGKRNSKSAEDANAFEAETVEQSEEGQSTDLNESQTSEDLNEIKVSSQLNDTETEQLDNSKMSEKDIGVQDLEMTDENPECQSDNVDNKNQQNCEAMEISETAATEIQPAHNLSPMGEFKTKPDLMDENEIDVKKSETENIEKQSQENDNNAKSEVSQDKQLLKESTDNKQQKTIEEESVISYKPHTFPEVNCNALMEKWEWHIRLYPVDYTDTRYCVFNSASKLAEETWLHVDKKNNGMGTYNLCIRGDNDASEVVLRIMQAPMKYRYITLDVTRRSPSKDAIDHLQETFTENENSDLQTEIGNLPKTEVKETAVLLLDFMNIKSFDGIEGKEKKRSLFVKYLPEGTTKELLSVLFPLANNLDIKKTGKGRCIGDLNVSEVNNILGYCKSYVSININGTKNIFLDWKEDDTDDVEILEALEDSPLEVLPGSDEIQYEAVPVVEEDETVQYLKRKRDIEIEHRRNRASRNDGNRAKDGRGRMKGDLNRTKLEGIRPLMEISSVDKREKRSRWDKDVGADVLKRQMVMNEKIHSQLAMLQSSSIGAIPSLLDTPIMQVTRGRKDRKRDRFERDRKNAESNRLAEIPRQNRDKNLNRRDRSGDRRNSRDGRPDHYGRGGRFDVPVRGGHFGGGNRFDDRRGRGGRFNEDRFSHMGGRFPGQNRGGPFDTFGRDVGPPSDIPGRGAAYDARGGPFEPPGRMDMPGRGGHFPHTGRGNGRFDVKGRGGHFDSAGRGGHFDAPVRSSNFEHPGRSGNFEPPRKGGHFESAARGNYDSSGRGGHFDSSGRGGHFDSTGRGGHFDNQSRGAGRFDGQGRGAPHYDRQGRGARFDAQGRGGAQGDIRGRGKSSFDNRNKGTNFESRGNNNFGQQNTYEQQNYGGNQDYGNQQNYNYNNQQTGYDNQSSYSSTQSGYNTQVSYNQQNPYNQGSYDTQQNAVTTNQSTDYTTQQTAQTGYTTQVAQPVSYPTQTSVYGGQQTSYDQGTWAQAYSVQQPTSYASNSVSGTDGSYWGQSADYTSQTPTSTAVGQQQDYSQAYGQPSTATNQAAGYTYNTQNMNTLSSGTDYTTDAAAAVAAYTNQGFYSTGQQQTAGVTDATYGTYTTQDTSVYGTAQSTLTTAYNFAQYPSSSS